MRFKSYWRTTILIAVFLHFFVCLALAVVVPRLHFDTDPIPADEMEVVDLGDSGVSEEETEKEPEQSSRQQRRSRKLQYLYRKRHRSRSRPLTNRWMYLRCLQLWQRI